MKALIAMSGGVDSSVAAYLTKEMGYDCVGCTMKLFENEDAGVPKDKACCSLEDSEDARSVAYRIGMPFYVFNFKEEFRRTVIDAFVDSYRHGRTPNPCIDCNRYLKFGKLFQRAQELGCDVVVTGHYARIGKQGEKYVLRKALDESKDQSYVLYSLTQEQLAHTLFPLGGMPKTETRAIAEREGFLNANKPDSQDICFVPDGDYARVIEEYSGETSEPGDYVDLDGKVIGRHKGIIHYTIGQHKKLGQSFGEPKYVCRIDAEHNRVVLGRNEDVFSREVRVGDFNWISGETPAEPVRCTAKIRYRKKDEACTAEVQPDGSVLLTFDEPQRAVTPGQAAVLYDGDIVLGGGTIL
ncbi:MAG: tRNA 2-thiouridine(34) synthase MnmA [Firmicutes bacterium]|nr:tRNA 2-thiouridine(34) synthase MnmA [Bacillota bacterium]